MPDIIGEVLTNDLKNSITKENLVRFVNDSKVGLAVTDIVSDVVAGLAHTIFTDRNTDFSVSSQLVLAQVVLVMVVDHFNTLYNANLVGYADPQLVRVQQQK